MRNLLLTALLVAAPVQAAAARLPGPYPSDEPAEPPPPRESVATDDDGAGNLEAKKKRPTRPVYEETTSRPTIAAPQ